MKLKKIFYLILFILFNTSVLFAADDQLSDEFNRAKQLYKKRKFIEAGQLFERIAKDSEKDEVRFKSFYNAGLSIRQAANQSLDTSQTLLYLKSFNCFKNCYKIYIPDKKAKLIKQFEKVLNSDILVDKNNIDKFIELTNFYESIINDFPEKLYIQDKIIILKNEIAKNKLHIANSYFNEKNFDTAISKIEELRKESPNFKNIDFNLLAFYYYKYENYFIICGAALFLFILLLVITKIIKYYASKKNKSSEFSPEDEQLLLNAKMLEKHQRKFRIKMNIYSLFKGFKFIEEKITALEKNRISDIFELCQKNKNEPETAAPLYEYLFTLGWDNPLEYFELTDIYVGLRLTDSAVKTLLRMKVDKLDKEQLLKYYLQLAELSQRSGNLNYAIRQLEQALKLSDNPSEIYQKIADLCALTKNYLKAADIYYDCFSADSSTLQIVETKLELLYRQTDSDEDKHHILDIVEKIFIAAEADLKLLEVYLAKYELAPNDMVNLTKLGKTYIKLDLFTQSFEVFQRREEFSPENLKLKKALSILASITDNKNDELKYLLAVFYSPEPLETARIDRLISLLRDKNDFDNLYAVYRRLIELKPDSIDDLKSFINILITSKRINEFNEYIKLLVSRYPEDIIFAEDRIEIIAPFIDDQVRLFKLKIEIYSIADKTEKVEEYYTKLFEAFQNEPLLEERISYAAILKETNREKEAIKIYEKIISLDSSNPENLRSLGNMYLNQKMLREAKEIFEKILKINPEDAVAGEKIEYLESLVKNEQVMKYQDLLNDEDTPLDKKFEIQYNLAREYFQQGFNKLCLDEVKNIIKRANMSNDYYSKSLILLANTYIALRQTGIAIQYLSNIFLNRRPQGEEEKLIKYLLAKVYSAHDDKPKAKALLEELAVADDNYRDISKLLDKLADIKSSRDGLIIEQSNKQQSKTDVKKSTLERYEIIKELGRGGMGVVYKARDLKLDRIVALKQLPPNTDANSETAKRLFFEAKAAAKLNHPNILNVYDVGDSADELYISMEYIEGKTLTDIIHTEAYSFEPLYIKNISIQICGALDYAHTNNIIHRDIKPDNIMITSENKIKIMDFGLAKRSDLASSMTQDGIAMGTAQYMSPEQIKGDNIDNRTDLYAFGCMLYEMIIKNPPFNSTNINALIYKHLSAKPQSLKTLNPAIPDIFEKIVMKCLEKDKEKRYLNAAEIIAEFTVI